MSPELKRLLEEYLDELPFYKRWAVRAVLELTAPEASPLFGCMVILIVIAIIFGLVWQLGCWLGWWPNLC